MHDGIDLSLHEMSPPPDILDKLERRLGRLHARQRLGIERDYEARIFGHGLNFFHIENWYSIHAVITGALKLAGLYGRGRRNASNVQVRHHAVRSPGPAAGLRRVHHPPPQRPARGHERRGDGQDHRAAARPRL